MKTPLLLIALLVPMLAACEEAAPPPQPAPVAATAADVAGRWQIEPSAYRDAAYNMLLNEGLSKAEIESRLDTVAGLLGRNPPEYTINADGTFTAKSSTTTVTGSWTVEGDVLTLSDAAGERTRRFRVDRGLLTSIAEQEGARAVTMIRR
jgi:hypothetical protein